MELLIIELGISWQPLQESFETYGKWVTNTWIKSVWEKVRKLNITIEIAPLPINPPRADDKWFMQAVRETRARDSKELAIISRAHCHQQVLFLSDVLNTGGKSVDKKYLNFRQEHKVWSTVIFPYENHHNNTRQHGGRQYMPLPLGGGCKIASANSSLKAIRCGNGGTTRNQTLCFTCRER